MKLQPLRRFQKKRERILFEKLEKYVIMLSIFTERKEKTKYGYESNTGVLWTGKG